MGASHHRWKPRMYRIASSGLKSKLVQVSLGTLSGRDGIQPSPWWAEIVCTPHALQDSVKILKLKT